MDEGVFKPEHKNNSHTTFAKEGEEVVTVIPEVLILTNNVH